MKKMAVRRYTRHQLRRYADPPAPAQTRETAPPPMLHETAQSKRKNGSSSKLRRWGPPQGLNHGIIALLKEEQYFVCLRLATLGLSSAHPHPC